MNVAILCFTLALISILGGGFLMFWMIDEIARARKLLVELESRLDRLYNQHNEVSDELYDHLNPTEAEVMANLELDR